MKKVLLMLKNSNGYNSVNYLVETNIDEKKLKVIIDDFRTSFENEFNKKCDHEDIIEDLESRGLIKLLSYDLYLIDLSD